ncbi:MAG: nuclease-related domain-containing protein [Cyanobacteria bacterium J06628_6]
MIVKELDRISSPDKRIQAGYQAEKQLAFYLHRAFADNPKIQVINGLRLRRQGDVAQIDHLILHNHGLIIVESKSVTTRLRVNHHGEWSRWSGKQWQGMPSPVLQAQRQAEFLRKTMGALKGLAAKIDFQNIPIDSLIAISDTGIINRPDNRSTPNVCKAEQVPDRILSLIQTHSKGDSLLGWLKVVFEDSPRTLSDETLTKLAQRLIALHQPKKELGKKQTDRPVKGEPVKAAPAETSPVQPKVARPKVAKSAPNAINDRPTPTPTCRHCHSSQVKIVYGRYGYYFQCQTCEQNTNIKVICPSCDQKAKLRKQKRDFFISCPACKTETPFYTNPPE